MWGKEEVHLGRATKRETETALKRTGVGKTEGKRVGKRQYER
jgi:hypothetical protein